MDCACIWDWLWRHILVGDVGDALPPLTHGGAHNCSPANGLKDSARQCEAVLIRSLETFLFRVVLLKAAPVNGTCNAALAQRKMLFAAADFRHEVL